MGHFSRTFLKGARKIKPGMLAIGEFLLPQFTQNIFDWEANIIVEQNKT